MRAAAANGTIGRIVLAGNYSLTSAMCHPKDVDAMTWAPRGSRVGADPPAQAGTVVLDAGQQGQVVFVNGQASSRSGSTSGGKTVSSLVELLELCRSLFARP